MRALLKQINILNCILIVGIIVFCYFVLVPILTIEVRVPAPSNVPLKTAGQTQAAVAEQGAPPPLQEYAVIAEKNLFHPDRIIPVVKKEETIPRPEFVLNGTLIVDNVRIAYISDKKAPRTTPGRGKRQVGLKPGETLSGYTLKDVLPDGAVMVRGDDRIELKVISPESKKERGESGAPAIPGAKTVQPARPTPVGPQATPPSSVTNQAPTGQVPSVQQSPVTPPGPSRSRSRGGR